MMAEELKSIWRAEVGRLPRAHEPRLARLVQAFGPGRVHRSIISTRNAGLRRTADRWGFFLALFAESP